MRLLLFVFLILLQGNIFADPYSPLLGRSSATSRFQFLKTVFEANETTPELDETTREALVKKRGDKRTFDFWKKALETQRKRALYTRELNALAWYIVAAEEEIANTDPERPKEGEAVLDLIQAKVLPELFDVKKPEDEVAREIFVKMANPRQLVDDINYEVHATDQEIANANWRRKMATVATFGKNLGLTAGAFGGWLSAIFVGDALPEDTSSLLVIPAIAYAYTGFIGFGLGGLMGLVALPMTLRDAIRGNPTLSPYDLEYSRKPLIMGLKQAMDRNAAAVSLQKTAAEMFPKLKPSPESVPQSPTLVTRCQDGWERLKRIGEHVDDFLSF